MGIKCWNLGFNAHDSKTFIICSTTNIANEWYWLVENDKKKEQNEIWSLVPIELHLSPLYFFHWVFKISSSLWFYDYFFFTLWKALLPIGLRTEPMFNPYGNSSFNFFVKIIETNSYSWENLGLAFSLVLIKCDTWWFSIWKSDWKPKWKPSSHMKIAQHWYGHIHCSDKQHNG